MTVNAGGIAMNVMLFDMNHLFELFMFKAIRQVYGSRVHYQSGNNYLVHSVDSGRNYIRLRPDIAIYSDSGNYIIDTKWKMPISFAKESDIYQMNAYSTGIGKVERVFLLYPKTSMFLLKIDSLDSSSPSTFAFAEMEIEEIFIRENAG